MKRILITAALWAELKIIKEEIKKLNIQKNQFELNFFEMWMWNYKTILSLTRFLEKNKFKKKHFDLIINIWVCGYSWEDLDEKNNFIQISRIFNLASKKEIISPIFFKFWEIKNIFSSEKIIFDENKLVEKNFWDKEKKVWNIFVDMESYGFELVCEHFEVPRIILKIPVDKIWEETKNFDFEKAKQFLREKINYEKLFWVIKNFFNENKIFFESKKISWEEIKEKILKFYDFTFSEKIILEKLMNKILVLKIFDLKIFFEEKKYLDKKNFLRELRKKEINW